MISNKRAVYLISLYLQIVLPLDAIDRLLIRRYDTIIAYILLTIYAIFLFYFIYSYSYWEHTNFYLRYVYGFFIAIGVLLSVYRIFSTDNIVFGDLRDLESRPAIVIWTITLIIIDISIILSKIKKKNCLNLSFPFKSGRYLVIDGGDGKLSYFTNYHYYGWKDSNIKNYYTMQYAVDFIKLNKYGFSNKVLPKSNEDYYIFGEKVYSPVEGEVVKVEVNNDDNIPHGKLPNNWGNRVIIESDNYFISLYHFKKDTLVVNVGQKLKVGDYLGEVGSSGQSTRPHLHIHAVYCEDSNYQFGEGIPIAFKNIYPVKNCVIRA
ncbi:peptidase M23 [Proteiniborus sp. DW1]|uniref:M23 family metallopeptidase n=1 Tax=Proteiniborus sp. DW1 TaxID=1889883 RepID=UPI00092E1029|nr:M23 family metallopeptidase [Proteiniborus sp. DW1]SCG84018.1 peptidase M23 [Proteiniborus sp. DW1]